MSAEADVLVVGGGASGLFLAAHTAAAGLDTLVLEKRERPARKLLVTGKGRCNLTNDCDRETFLNHVVRGGRFLYSAASALSPQDVMRFFEARGAPLKTERGRRVFPASDAARDIVDALVGAARGAGARIATATAGGLLLEGGAVCGVRGAHGRCYRARHTVVATGGASYPATGSTGDGYRLATEAGHTVEAPAPALVRLVTAEDTSSLAGLSLRNVTLSLTDTARPKRPLYREMGELLFTHDGVSGPLALSASSYVDPARPADFALAIDLKPGLAHEKLDRRIVRDLCDQPNRDLGNVLAELLPRALILPVLAACAVRPDIKSHDVKRAQRAALAAALKAFPLRVRALGPLEEAIVTRGGVCLKEIDPRTMRSKRAAGLSFIGEVLGCDALTGGYNLQIAFCTAFAAANALKEELT